VGVACAASPLHTLTQKPPALPSESRCSVHGHLTSIYLRAPYVHPTSVLYFGCDVTHERLAGCHMGGHLFHAPNMPATPLHYMPLYVRAWPGVVSGGQEGDCQNGYPDPRRGSRVYVLGRCLAWKCACVLTYLPSFLCPYACMYRRFMQLAFTTHIHLHTRTHTQTRTRMSAATGTAEGCEEGADESLEEQCNRIFSGRADGVVQLWDVQKQLQVCACACTHLYLCVCVRARVYIHMYACM